MIRALVMTGALLASAGCANHMTTAHPRYLSPEQAVFNAAASRNGFTASFQMVVRASGRQDGILYLNSKRDYRDPRNLSIDINAATERSLAERLGGAVQPTLAGKTIVVRGTARKTRIDFINDDGRPSGKYYYQTHLVLKDARDLTVSTEGPVR